MTKPLFREDAYQTTASGRVTGHVEGGIILDQSLFYPMSGGQPGDKGTIDWNQTSVPVIDTVKGDADVIVLRLDDGAPFPPVGTEVVQTLDWTRRHAHMRVHTALHLLSVVIPLPVTGGSIGAEKGRLDFDMPDAPEDKEALSEALNALVAEDLPITERWISEAELDENPGLVKTMSVKPPRGSGQIRLVRIGTATRQVDLQPCGGTHVRSTAEIGPLRIGKIEKKGKQNRRVTIHLAG